jgi:hypothetical protein
VPGSLVTLGKDCTITGTGIDNAYVRTVTWQQTAKEVEYHPFGQRYIFRHTCGFDLTAEIDMLADLGVTASLQTGDSISISGSGYGGLFKVVNVTREEPLDGVVAIKVTAKLGLP